MGEAIVVTLWKNDPQLLWELDVGVCGVVNGPTGSNCLLFCEIELQLMND